MTKRANKKRTIRDIQSSLTPVTESGSSLFTLPRSLFHIIFGEYLKLKEVARFDNTVLNHDQRYWFLRNLSGMTSQSRGADRFLLRWLFQRHIKLTSLVSTCSFWRVDALAFELFPPDLSALAILDIYSLLIKDDEACVQTLTASLKQCKTLRSIRIDANFAGLFECPAFYSNLEEIVLKGLTCAELVQKIAVGCPNLQRVSFNCESSCEASLIELILKRGDKLTFIDFGATSKNIARYIARRCPLLTHLEGIFDISDDELEVFGACCPRLTQLGVKRCDQWTDVGLTALAKGCPLLVCFNLDRLRGARNISDNSIVHISESCTQLERLFLENLPKLTDKSLLAIGQNCKHLKELCLCNLRFSCEHLTAFCALPNLKGLRDIYLEVLTIDDDTILELVRNTHETLRSLNIKSCDVTDVAMYHIAQHCRMLYDMELHNLPFVSHPKYIADILNRNPNLTSIDCSKLSEFIVSEDGVLDPMLQALFDER